MLRRKFLSRLTLFPALLLLLGSCSQQQPLAVAAHPWIGYETLYLAREFGWLPAGVTLLETSVGGDSLAALRDGRADAAALTLDEVLTARANGLPLSVILVFDVSAGADMVLARPEIAQLPDLAGKRIGIEQSALGSMVLAKTLETAELKLDQVQVLDIPPDRQLAAWQANQVDAVVTYEPTATQLLALGAQRLFDSRSMPDTIFDVLAIRSDRLNDRKDQLQALLVAHFRALEHLRINRQDAIYRIAARQQVIADEIAAALSGVALPGWAGNHAYLSDGSRLHGATRTLNELMVRNGLLQTSDSLQNLYNADFMPAEKRGRW